MSLNKSEMKQCLWDGPRDIEIDNRTFIWLITELGINMLNSFLFVKLWVAGISTKVPGTLPENWVFGCFASVDWLFMQLLHKLIFLWTVLNRFNDKLRKVKTQAHTNRVSMSGDYFCLFDQTSIEI